ncbi:nitrate ABC transporter substrate-binding protein [Gordoniibacillus kamchatkensis]|uniref:Nitrate ABC transporter substrate-binding protein n=1 Tax=Gordoniibacillus kamchatkensis TaxID=1590651 RepID=A0ABR5A7V0_9BACL|nr:ABC transporter substrate-binding protein [Paenibacillus sp. VKM B-2647]KIL37140.1 nitrate ABC transporter substrate-binding protein [Paenibacillus sp. VKM B-2647]
MKKWMKPAGITTASVLAVSMLAAGCGKQDNQTAGSAAAPAPAAGGSNQAAATKPSGPPQKVKIMVGGLEKIIYLPAKLTESLGYFKDEGLDVELTSEAAGQNAEEALVAGQIDATVGFYDHTIDLQSKGKFLESVVQFEGVPGETLVVSNKLKDSVKTLADLKGKNIGVTGLGSSTNFLANYLVTKGGNTSKDYVPLAVGSGNTLIAAMQQGKVDLAVTTEPTVSMLKAKGIASTFVDMLSIEGTKQALGGTYPAACLYMRNDYVKGHPDITQKLANAFVKTLQYINTHSAEEIADKMPKEYYAGDKDMYVTALKASLPSFTKDGKMPADGPAKVLDVLTTFNPKLKDAKIDLSQTYTTQFVDKVK